VEKAAPTARPTATQVPPTATPTEESVDTFIAKVADVPPDSAFDFEWDGKPAIVVNLEGEYSAFRNVCTHNGCATKFYGGTTILNCPCHGSQFDAATGAVLQGPAETKLRGIEVVVEGDSIHVVV
jgi:nitrite reductase/ring-hydroxylating ferredoxin subunit